MTDSGGRPSRRVVLSAVAVGAAIGGGYSIGQLTAPDEAGEAAPAGSSSIQAVPATGIHQAGVVNPSDARPHAAFTSYDVDADSISKIRELLAGIGRAVLQLTAPGTTVPA